MLNIRISTQNLYSMLSWGHHLISEGLLKLCSGINSGLLALALQNNSPWAGLLVTVLHMNNPAHGLPHWWQIMWRIGQTWYRGKLVRLSNSKLIFCAHPFLCSPSVVTCSLSRTRTQQKTYCLSCWESCVLNCEYLQAAWGKIKKCIKGEIVLEIWFNKSVQLLLKYILLC